MSVVQKVLKFTWKELGKQGSFSLFFNIASLDINSLSSMLLKYYNSITDEGGIFILQKVLHCT